MNFELRKKLELLKKYSLQLFVLAIITILMIPSIFREGMFMDGLIYATIGHNMANGIGSFFEPVIEPARGMFYDHPPFAFWVQYFLFSMFGDSIWIEKIYSLITCLLSAFLINQIWRSINKEQPEYKKFGWLPVLLWICTPIVFWSFRNNMLENTVSVLTLGSINLLINASNSKQPYLKIILSGILLSLAFFTKGPVTLFPLAFFAIYYVTSNTRNFVKSLSSTILLLTGVGLIIIVSLNLDHRFYSYIESYFNIQVFNSLKGQRETVNNHFYILTCLAEELLPVLILIAIAFIGRYQRLKQEVIKNKPMLLLLLFIGISASFPIMISPKQLRFYIVPSIPYFALATSLIILPVVKLICDRLKPGHRSLIAAVSITILVVVPSLTLSGALGQYDRDKQTLEDVKTIGAFLGRNNSLGITSELVHNWSLVNYLQRYYMISCHHKLEKQTYVLLPINKEIPEGFELEVMKMNNVKLVRRK